MSINIKKYTKDQMAKMVEEAAERQEAAEAEAAAHFKDGVKLAEENEKLRGEIGTLTEKLDQMSGEAITRENVIANLKADADCLRNKLADTEAALGRANAAVAELKTGRTQQTKEIFEWQGTAQALHDDLLDARDRANYAEAHPWRNLWAWAKRKMVRHE
jgi:chromosome segregation ATPase|nr:MAG TPA: hypothetical protein [Caudoviricetes sp.]